ncbi:hypothetical protein P154DRAFT_570854 [Amniculicola lignicola CBS 123094]|uniref:F-box domain-containing protein n=1 Tax=Amniculicola lignicola CBS 123094 TaxID=1392246 RepID=A0A6A5WWP6_9PLEO|nr:hypothetical protein P154DRAFT_570854 [Amniculicola lignicola CBS 123094]
MGLHITVFPTELIEGISQHLQLADLYSLRLACRALAEKLSYYFGHTYCTKANTDFSLASFQRLDERSRSPGATLVTHLSLTWNKQAGQGLIWERDASNALLTDLPAVKQMCDIARRFTNCRSLRLDVPYDSDYAYDPGRDFIGCSDVVALGFILIAETSISLESMYCGTDKEKCTSNYRVKTVLIHTEQMKRRTFETTISNLKELSIYLQVDTTWEHPHFWPMDLINLSPNLTKLEWSVAKYGYGGNLFDPIQLPYLEDGRALSPPATFPGLDDTVEVPGSSGGKLQLAIKGITPETQKVVGLDYSGPGTQNVVATLAQVYDELGRPELYHARGGST